MWILEKTNGEDPFLFQTVYTSTNQPATMRKMSESRSRFKFNNKQIKSLESIFETVKAGTCKEITIGKRVWIAATSGCYMILGKKSSMEVKATYFKPIITIWPHSLMLLRKSTRYCYCMFLN